mgnify:CR=1 FL=1
MDESKPDPATIEAVRETHVFLNSGGSITIRQIDERDDDFGAIVTFHPMFAKAVIAAIRQAVKESRDAG